MNCYLYSLVLQWKLDIRSKSLLVTFYIVPLIFFLIMGGILKLNNYNSNFKAIAARLFLISSLCYFSVVKLMTWLSLFLPFLLKR